WVGSPEIPRRPGVSPPAGWLPRIIRAWPRPGRIVRSTCRRGPRWCRTAGRPGWRSPRASRAPQANNLPATEPTRAPASSSSISRGDCNPGGSQPEERPEVRPQALDNDAIAFCRRVNAVGLIESRISADAFEEERHERDAPFLCDITIEPLKVP